MTIEFAQEGLQLTRNGYTYTAYKLPDGETVVKKTTPRRRSYYEYHGKMVLFRALMKASKPYTSLA